MKFFLYFYYKQANLSDQIQLHECASYSYCAYSWCQQTNPLRKKNILHDFLLWDFTTKKLVKTLRQQFKLNMETRSFTA